MKTKFFLKILNLANTLLLIQYKNNSFSDNQLILCTII